MASVGRKDYASWTRSNAAVVDACARDALRPCRAALQEKQRELIRMHEEARAARDAAIRAYVDSLGTTRPTSAAA